MRVETFGNRLGVVLEDADPHPNPFIPLSTVVNCYDVKPSFTRDTSCVIILRIGCISAKQVTEVSNAHHH